MYIPYLYWSTVPVPHYLVRLVFTPKGQKKVWRNTQTSLSREYLLCRGRICIDMIFTVGPHFCDFCHQFRGDS